MKLKRFAVLTILLTLLLGVLPAHADTELEVIINHDCQIVTLNRTESYLANGAAVYISRPVTYLQAVDEELNTVIDDYLQLLTPGLQALDRRTVSDDRLDVGVLYSQTGTSWLSFMIYARVTRGGTIVSTDFTTRTYDMLTGTAITLTTVFNENSDAWGILEAGVRKAFLRYYPDMRCNTRVVAQMLRRDHLYKAEFTLHGMSLVLHYSAALLFEGKSTIIQVPFYYPELYGHMSDVAYEQTDNGRYYSMVCLTYNDGPSRASTPRVLNTLTENGVRASFFISGSNIADTTALVQRERDDGHSVGGQNWLNVDTSAWPVDAVCAIRTLVDDALTETTGIPSAYNRAPGGITQPLLDAKTGWALIAWSVYANDLTGIVPDAVAARVRAQTADGDIILLHDTNARCDVNTQLIIDSLKADGYLFLTVDEMFAKDRVPFLGNIVYYRCAGGDFSPK